MKRLILLLLFFLIIQQVSAEKLIVDSKYTDFNKETVVVNITLADLQNGLSGYNITLTVENPSLADIISVDFPEWVTLKDYSNLPSNTVWIKAVDLNEKVQGNVSEITLAKITLKIKRIGISQLAITSYEIDDDEGSQIDITIQNGTILVDVNGNGKIDIGDVVYVAHIVVGKIKQNLNADFNGNGRVDVGDLAKIAYYLLKKIDKL
jgi:hypothetical protein